MNHCDCNFNDDLLLKPNAIIILNTPLNWNFLENVWGNACVKLCADGGANRLYDTTKELIPDAIVGDLDSLRQDVADYYKSRGVHIIKIADQFSTDLGKCMHTLSDIEHKQHPILKMQVPSSLNVVLMGGLTGRLDQTISLLCSLHDISQNKQQRRVYAVDQESLAICLSQGNYHLTIDPSWLGKTCGILPLFGEAHVVTKGFEWNLGPNDYAYPTSMVTSVSTSNHILGHKVELSTDVHIIFTVEVRKIERLNSA